MRPMKLFYSTIFKGEVPFLLYCLLLLGFMPFCCAKGLLLTTNKNESLTFSRILEEPETIKPRFSEELGAFVTEVELHVRLRRMSVPLFLNESDVSTEMRSKIGEEALSPYPSHLFAYSGRVYEISSSSNNRNYPTESRFLYSFVPGPTLRVAPGGYLRLKLVNDLEDRSASEEKKSLSKHEEDNCAMSGCNNDDKKFPLSIFFTMHEPNITNIHFHGLHCDPNIDNPFLSIQPRLPAATELTEQQNRKLVSEHEYLVPVLQSHAPGLHWYHAHSHGSVYFQLMGGLFGALIVDERPSRDSDITASEQSFYPNHHNATSTISYPRLWLASTTPSRLLVFHLFRLASPEGNNRCDGQTMDEIDQMIHNTLQPSNPEIISLGIDERRAMAKKDSLVTAPNLFLVNGQHRPVVILEEGQPTTLRMLYAAGSCYLNISFPCTTEASICFSSFSKGSSLNLPLHKCLVIPRAADGVPFDFSSEAENFYSTNSTSLPSPVSSAHEFGPSPLQPQTSWLYFTPATRHEVVMFCDRTKDVKNDEMVNMTGNHTPHYPVRDQDNETIFFIQISPKKNERNPDKSPKRNSTDSGRHTKVRKGKETISSNVNTTVLKGRKESMDVDNAISPPLIPIAFPPTCMDEGKEQDINCVWQSTYFVKPPGYLELPPARGNTVTLHHNKSRNTSVYSDEIPVFRWDLSLSQRYVVDAAPYKTSKDRPFYVLGEGSDCSHDKERLGSNKNRITGNASNNTGIENSLASSKDSKCYFHPFEGRRGETNLSAYHGFISSYDEVVEVHIFGDPTDLMPHPFHFHVNHFQFVSFVPRVGGQHEKYTDNLRSFGLSPGQWRDTIPILDGETVIRWRTANFSGEILYHCHMLSHEDRGMMSSYYVLPPATNLRGESRFSLVDRLSLHSDTVTFLILLLFILLLFLFLLKKKFCGEILLCHPQGESSGKNERSELFSSSSHHRYGATDP